MKSFARTVDFKLQYAFHAIYRIWGRPKEKISQTYIEWFHRARLVGVGSYNFPMEWIQTNIAKKDQVKTTQIF
jgi:hypothetical protein